MTTDSNNEVEDWTQAGSSTYCSYVPSNQCRPSIRSSVSWGRTSRRSVRSGG